MLVVLGGRLRCRLPLRPARARRTIGAGAARSRGRLGRRGGGSPSWGRPLRRTGRLLAARDRPGPVRCAGCCRARLRGGSRCTQDLSAARAAAGGARHASFRTCWRGCLAGRRRSPPLRPRLGLDRGNRRGRGSRLTIRGERGPGAVHELAQLRRAAQLAIERRLGHAESAQRLASRRAGAELRRQAVQGLLVFELSSGS